MSRKLEVFLVVGLVVFALGLAVAVFPRIRCASRSPMNECINQLRQIEGAKDQWWLDHGKKTNDVPAWSDLRPYFNGEWTNAWKSGKPVCPDGGTYTIGRLDQLPKCSGRGHTL